MAEAIRAAATAYRDAVSKGDTAAIRAAWTADGDIVDGWGTRFEARADEVIAGKAATGPRPELRMGGYGVRRDLPSVPPRRASVAGLTIRC